MRTPFIHKIIIVIDSHVISNVRALFGGINLKYNFGYLYYYFIYDLFIIFDLCAIFIMKNVKMYLCFCIFYTTEHAFNSYPDQSLSNFDHSICVR